MYVTCLVCRQVAIMQAQAAAQKEQGEGGQAAGQQAQVCGGGWKREARTYTRGWRWDEIGWALRCGVGKGVCGVEASWVEYWKTYDVGRGGATDWCVR